MSHSLLSKEAGLAWVNSLRTGIAFDASQFVIEPSIEFSASDASVPDAMVPESPVTIAGRESWRILFTSVESIEDLIEWEKTIPRYCECEPFYQTWKKDNPPGNSIDFQWKYRLKSAVNAKLGRPNITLAEAQAEWLGKQNPLPEGEGRVRGPRAT